MRVAITVLALVAMCAAGKLGRPKDKLKFGGYNGMRVPPPPPPERKCKGQQLSKGMKQSALDLRRNR